MIQTLYVCDTLYQIIVAYCIQNKLREEAAIILTDHVINMHNIYRRLEKYTTLFDQVFFVEAKKYAINYENFPDKVIDAEILSFLKNNELASCNHLLVGSLDPFMVRLFKVFKHDIGNKDIYGAIIEDGFSTYSYFGKVIQEYKYNSDFKYIYLYNPSLLAWKPKARVVKVDTSGFSDKKFVRELNDIFGYYEMKDDYKEQYIVLASGYNEIAQIKNLREILSDLEEIAGKDNILIKVHPRLQKSLYEKYGYKINKSTTVPWEIIALNQDLSDKVVITSYSGALFTPIILFGKKTTGITVMNFSDQDDPHDSLNYYKNYLMKEYQDYVYAPANRDEYRKLLAKA